MAMRTLTRMFDDHTHAQKAVRELEAAGFTGDEVSVMAGEDRRDAGTTTRAGAETEPDSGAGVGATVGTLLGGGTGLLAGIGALAIPGVGPVVAAGWLVAAITGAGAGAATGGLLGSLVGSGVDEEDAHVYAEGVRRGGTLVSVRASETRLEQAEQILARHQPVNVSSRAAEYRTGGWSGYRDDEDPRTSGTWDGKPSDPPGTMASRTADRTASATPGAMSSRTDRDGGILGSSPDRTPDNPPARS